MDKQELNERIAGFMGLERGKFNCWYDGNGRAPRELGYRVGNNTICPDFTAPENWGKVATKLLEKCLRVEITHSAYGYDCAIYDSPDNRLAYSGCVDDIGEAVCQAVCEYLKAREANK